MQTSHDTLSQAHSQVHASTQVSCTQVQHLVKMAITRPEAAIRQILADEAIEQDLRALRAYPAALVALWRADNAPKMMRQTIEEELESIGIQFLS